MCPSRGGYTSPRSNAIAPMPSLQIINQFFDKIIRIVHFWGGDIIKFSGDALTIVWPVDDEDENEDGATFIC